MPACDHCLLEVEPAAAISEGIGERIAIFCCAGCRNIYRLLQEEGLDGFYARRRGWTPGPPSVPPIDPERFLAVQRESGDDREMDLVLSGIRCASCVWLIEKHLGRKDGVRHVRVNYATRRSTIRWNPAQTDAGAIASWIAELGYHPSPGETTATEEALDRERKDLLLRLGTAAFLSSQIMMVTTGLYAGYFQGMEPGYRTMFHLVAWALATPILLYSGYPFLKNTLGGIRRMPGMDALVFLGSFSAYAYSVAMIFAGGEVYFDTTAMIVTLILLGRYLEATARSRASDTISGLFRLAPSRARRILLGGEGMPRRVETVPVSAIRENDRIEIVPGERIPADGIVAEGISEADESLLTGEARPVPKAPGSRVFTGTVNGTGMLRIEVTGAGRNTALARIVRAVEEAQSRKTAVQRLADKVVVSFVPGVLLVSLLTLGGRLLAGNPAVPAFLASISVLVVACPCALGLATPLAVYMGTSAAQSRGILVKGGDVLETGSKVDTVFFDKTGTLTQGSPRLTDTAGFPLPPDEVLGIAAALESSSEHSLAKAIRKEIPMGGFRDASDFRAHPGMGVEGVLDGTRYLLGREEFLGRRGIVPSREQREIARIWSEEGKSVIWLSDEMAVLGLLAVADALRAETAECVRILTRNGYDVRMVTGDGEGPSRKLARESGIGDVLCSLNPREKADEIRKARSGGAVLLMVGDGINDAPALSEADVGLAMGRGTDIAHDSADAVLMHEDLRLVPRFLSVSKKTMRIIRQNLFWAFSYNAVAIPLAVSGRLHPIVSAGLMAISSLVVVGNSLRLRNEAA